MQPAEFRFVIGRSLAHFRITAKLGQGGMGVVFRAEDTKLGREVAIKVLPEKLFGDANRLSRFAREARALAALNHPNILTIYSIEEADGVRFLATELVEGSTLTELIPGGGMGIDDFMEIAVPLTDALAAAHAEGITHRDLEPRNVMVTDTGRLKVLDFGLAKQRRMEAGSGATETTEALTRDGQVLGTSTYMSPEQAQGKPVDQRSDLFSLGVIFYEMLSGRRPFAGGSAADLLAAVLRDQPQPLGELKPSVPGYLDELVRRCLEKDPDERPQHVDEIRQQLTTRGEPETRLQGATRGVGARRRTGVRWMVGLVAVAVIGGLVGWTALRSPGAEEPFATELALPAIRSLAVLPLQNLSGDPNQAYFADGMTEALSADLAQISSLRVISRTSVMQYKGARDKSLPEIASELDVEAVIEGSAARLGDRVRITAQLVHAPTDRHLWARTYMRDVGDLLALQSEVARAVAREIQAKLTPNEENRLSEADAVDPQAYDDYLKGLFHFYSLNPDQVERAREYFELRVCAVVVQPGCVIVPCDPRDHLAWVKRQ